MSNEFKQCEKKIDGAFALSAFETLKNAFDLLNNTAELEEVLHLLPEDKRDELYNHPALSWWDLLP